MPKSKSSVGQMLLKSLTSEQISNLLTVVSASMDLNTYMEKFEKIDPDMATTVKKILAAEKDPARIGRTKRLASVQRNMEFWHSLWRNWDDIISEVGDEDGKYAVQDHHWEPPYFDGWSLAQDLEPIVEDMLSLIKDVFGEVDDPDLFSKALEEIDDQIGSYPEWMGVEHGEPCGLEEKVTRCVLKWLWLSLQHEKYPGQTLAEKAADLEGRFEMVALDGNAFIDFFVKLPAGICREIYEFLKGSDHGVDLDNTYSPWHQINHDYEERFDTGKYLETCRKHLTKNWRYGRPLVDDALKQNDFQKAESLLIKTFSSYLDVHSKKKWRPETSLLLKETRSYSNEGDEEIASLLTIWADVAKRLNLLERSAAAELQAVVFRTPENWNMVLKAFRRLSSLDTQKKLNPLFAQWKDEMAAVSYPYFMDQRKISDTWIHWLIDAILDVKQNKELFLDKLNEWLSGLKDNTKAFRKQWHWVARLTKDLPDGKILKEKYPSLWKTVLPENSSGEALTASRRKGLRELKAGQCLETVLEVWQKQLRRIVPDPAHAYKSDYEEHSRWAQALFELNRDEYRILITNWLKKHNRRRNLWRDMQARHLPVDRRPLS
ncbi:MAG TPA: hypothetical protein ENI07_19190 [Desulfobacterales bacterium]|nr:hypothetical protein [Desulfobacterales bacterium]